MSEESKKVLGITVLPIFGLPLVLLPFEFLPLHLFEPRYREMLADVQMEKNFFGVSRFEPTDISPENPEVGSIGCVAEIHEVQTLDDGRSNILTVGVIRYRITGYLNTDKPYPIAEVEFFEDDENDKEQETKELAGEVFSLFRRVARAAHQASGNLGQLPDIPQAEPEQLSFLISAAFGLDNRVKSEILETRSTFERLTTINSVLKKEVVKVEEMIDINKKSRTNGHIKKKIDLDGM